MKALIRIWLTTQRWAGSIVGPIFIVIAIVTSVHTIQFLRASQKTSGTVIGLTPYLDDDGDTTYAAVFRYSTADGSAHTIESGLHSKPAGFSIGQNVRIRYRAEDPDDARIDSFFQLWLLPLMCGIAGTGASLFAAWLWKRHLGKRHSASTDELLAPATSRQITDS